MNGSYLIKDEQSHPYLNSEDLEAPQLNGSGLIKDTSSIDSFASMRDGDLMEITRDIIHKSKNPIKVTFDNIEYEVTIKPDKKAMKLNGE